MSKKLSIYNATYSRIDEMLGMDRSDSASQKNMDAAQDNYDRQEETDEYVDDFDENDMEMMSDAQDIAGMAASQHSEGNIDQLAYALGYNSYHKNGQQTASEGEVLIDDIKEALANGEISYTELFRKHESGESIVKDIDFMKNL